MKEFFFLLIANKDTVFDVTTKNLDLKYLKNLRHNINIDCIKFSLNEKKI